MNIALSSELHFDDSFIQNILNKVNTIAMVGASPNWVRPSNFVMKYLQYVDTTDTDIIISC